MPAASAESVDQAVHTALVRRDPQACRDFVNRHYQEVHRFFAWLVRDHDAAADLTQETFAGFWQSLDGRTPGDTADSRLSDTDLTRWLFGIARNRWRKRCRDTRAWREAECRELHEPDGETPHLTVELPDTAPGPEESALLADDHERVRAAVAELPADLREALVLRVFGEMDYGCIAEVLGIREGLARWRVHQARRRLRQRLAAAMGLGPAHTGIGDRQGERGAATR